MVSQQIQDLLSQAGELSSQIKIRAKNKQNLSVDLMECVNKLQRIKISVGYRNKDAGLSSKEKQAIEEICQMMVDAEMTVMRMRDW